MLVGPECNITKEVFVLRPKELLGFSVEAFSCFLRALWFKSPMAGFEIGRGGGSIFWPMFSHVPSPSYYFVLKAVKIHVKSLQCFQKYTSEF